MFNPIWLDIDSNLQPITQSDSTDFVNRLWLYSNKSWLDSDSTWKNFWWLWLKGLVSRVLIRRIWSGHITVLPQQIPKLFSRNLVVCFFEVDKTYIDVLLPRFLENLLESVNLVCSVSAGTKTTLGIIQLWVNYSRHLFQGTWHILFQGG